MACDCIKRIDADLVPKGAKIARGFMLCDNDGPVRGMDVTPPFIELERIGTGRRRTKAPKLMATFCPFCGVKYAQ